MADVEAGAHVRQPFPPGLSLAGSSSVIFATKLDKTRTGYDIYGEQFGDDRKAQDIYPGGSKSWTGSDGIAQLARSFVAVGGGIRISLPHAATFEFEPIADKGQTNLYELSGTPGGSGADQYKSLVGTIDNSLIHEKGTCQIVTQWRDQQWIETGNFEFKDESSDGRPASCSYPGQGEGVISDYCGPPVCSIEEFCAPVENLKFKANRTDRGTALLSGDTTNLDLALNDRTGSFSSTSSLGCTLSGTLSRRFLGWAKWVEDEGLPYQAIAMQPYRPSGVGWQDLYSVEGSYDASAQLTAARFGSCQLQNCNPGGNPGIPSTVDGICETATVSTTTELDFVDSYIILRPAVQGKPEIRKRYYKRIEDNRNGSVHSGSIVYDLWEPLIVGADLAVIACHYTASQTYTGTTTPPKRQVTRSWYYFAPTTATGAALTKASIEAIAESVYGEIGAALDFEDAISEGLLAWGFDGKGFARYLDLANGKLERINGIPNFQSSGPDVPTVAGSVTVDRWSLPDLAHSTRSVNLFACGSNVTVFDCSIYPPP